MKRGRPRNPIKERLRQEAYALCPLEILRHSGFKSRISHADLLKLLRALKGIRL